MYLLMGWFVAAVVFGLLGAYVAAQKGRSGAEGFILGSLFLPIGALIAAMLPNVEAPSRRDDPAVVEPDEPRIIDLGVVARQAGREAPKRIDPPTVWDEIVTGDRLTD